MTPHISSQFTRPVLDVTGGLNGIRVVFAGGPIYEVIHEFPTLAEAGAAYRAALLATDRLDAICRGVRA